MGSFSAFSQPIFSEDRIINITVKTNLNEIIGRKHQNSGVYYPALITDNKGIELEGKIKSRGFNRLGVCSFPPLKLKLKSNQSNRSLFQSFREFKIVTHCDKNGYSDDLNITDDSDVIKEYLIYKAYQAVTPFSFNVQLLKINYIDSEGKTPPQERLAFFIEDVDDLAKRNNLSYIDEDKVDLKNFSLNLVNASNVYTVYGFQYFIQNGDWSIISNGKISLQNMKSFYNKNGEIIFVPYDFDKADFVTGGFGWFGDNYFDDYSQGLSDLYNRFYNNEKYKPVFLSISQIDFNKMVESHFDILSKQWIKIVNEYHKTFVEVTLNH